MGRGLPSWHKYRSFGQVHEDVKLGELAVRLGSPVSFDRRGNVMFMDTFEYGLNKWVIGGSGLAYKAIPSVDYTISGGIAAKLVAGSTLYHRVDITKDFRGQPASVFGFETAFMVWTDCDYFQLDGFWSSEALEYWGGLRYDRANEQWQYGDDTTGWTAFLESWDVLVTTNMFHNVKVVIDATTGLYVRAIVDGVETDLSAYSLRSVTVAGDALLQPRLRFTGLDANNDECYVDNVIITVNEPT